MGFGGISIWQLLIVLAIIILIFGTKRLRNMGGDLGSAFKGFKRAVNEESESSSSPSAVEDAAEVMSETAKKEEGEVEEGEEEEQELGIFLSMPLMCSTEFLWLMNQFHAPSHRAPPHSPSLPTQIYPNLT